MRGLARARANRCAVVSRHLSPDAKRRRVDACKRVEAVHDGRRSESFERALLTGRTGGGSGLQVKAARPATARAVSCPLGLEPGGGACERHRTSEVGSLPVKARPALVRRGGSDIEACGAERTYAHHFDASGRVHRSWRQRIAAPRLVRKWIPPARTAWDPERTTPLSRCAG